MPLPTLPNRRDFKKASDARKPNMRGSGSGDGSTSAPARSSIPDSVLSNPESVESEITPRDRNDTDNYLPTEEEKNDIALANSRFEQAASARRYHEGRWFESLAMYNDEHYLAWTSSTGRLRDVRPKNSTRLWSKNNKLRPLANKLHARGIAGKIEASVSPLTGLPTDIAAARQARSGLAHLDRLHDDESQIRDMALECMVFAPVYRLHYFDPKKTVTIPDGFDAQTGQFTGVEDAEVGEIVREVRSSIFLYFDPKAKHPYEAGWVIDADVRSLEWIQETHPELGKHVVADASEGPGGMIENMLATVSNDMPRPGTETGAKCAVYKRMFELPTLRYEKGRYMVVAGGVLLVDREFPSQELAKKRRLPYSYLPYRKGIGTLYGDNALFVGIEAQRNRNRAQTYEVNRLRRGDGIILLPWNSEVKPDAFKSGEPDTVVPFKGEVQGGGKPEYMQFSPLDPSVPNIIDRMDHDLGEMLEVSDLSASGTPPPGVTAAVAFEALLDADKTGAAIFASNLKQFVIRSAEIDIDLMRENYMEPRLVFIQDSVGASPMGKAISGAAGQDAPDQPQPEKVDPFDSPRVEAMAFSELSKGRVVVGANSSTPHTPAFRQQQLMDMAKAGMFTPEALPVTIALLEQLEIEQPDKMVQDLLRALKMQLDIMHARAMAEAQSKQGQQGPPSPPPDPAQIAQLRTAGDVAKIHAQGEVDMALKRMDQFAPPKVSIAVKGDPAFALAAEEQTGYDVHGAAAHQAGVAAGSPDLAHVYGLPQPTPPAPDPMALASHNAMLQRQGAEHGGRLEMQKAQATQAMTPPPPPPAPEAPAEPDPNEELARQKELITHQADEEIRAAQAMPPNPSTKR